MASTASGSSARTVANASTSRCWAFSGTRRATLTNSGTPSGRPNAERSEAAPAPAGAASMVTPRGTTEAASTGRPIDRQLVV